MRKLILTALAGTAALGLAACDSDPDTIEDGDTTIIAEEPAPTVTETAVVTETPNDGSTVSVGPNGVNADVDAGDVRVTTDGKSATVETD
jgi:starvation-inducible outer membrane lipoprotein